MHTVHACHVLAYMATAYMVPRPTWCRCLHGLQFLGGLVCLGLGAGLQWCLLLGVAGLHGGRCLGHGAKTVATASAFTGGRCRWSPRWRPRWCASVSTGSMVAVCGVCGLQFLGGLLLGVAASVLVASMVAVCLHGGGVRRWWRCVAVVISATVPRPPVPSPWWWCLHRCTVPA